MNKNIKDNIMEHNHHFTTQQFDRFTITDVRARQGDASFLIDDGTTSVLYDTGFGFTGFQIAKNIQMVLKDRKLDYIFLSHSHYDHALACANIKRVFPEAIVVAGSYAANVFTREGALNTMRQLNREHAKHCKVDQCLDLADELCVDMAVDEGDIINTASSKWEVINVPGHTKCSVVYLEKDSGLLLSSETFGVYKRKANTDKLSDSDEFEMMPSFLISYQQTIESIEKVARRAAAGQIRGIVLPHHGLLDTNECSVSRLFEMAVADSCRAKDLILGLLRKGACEDDIIEAFAECYGARQLSELYPEAAMRLNTSIMIKLIEREFADA